MYPLLLPHENTLPPTCCHTRLKLFLRVCRDDEDEDDPPPPLLAELSWRPLPMRDDPALNSCIKLPQPEDDLMLELMPDGFDPSNLTPVDGSSAIKPAEATVLLAPPSEGWLTLVAAEGFRAELESGA